MHRKIEMTLFQNTLSCQTKAIETGQKMENLACQYLKKKGLRLLLQNYRCKMGEIDLIMQDNDYLVFIEVRYRRQASHGSSLESIHYAKQVKLIRTAEYYLLTHHLSMNCNARFDIVAIDGKANLINECDLKIHWLKNVIELK
jgi:putative endonuclease